MSECKHPEYGIDIKGSAYWCIKCKQNVSMPEMLLMFRDLEAENARLREAGEALVKHAKHTDTCNLANAGLGGRSFYRCECGRDEAVANWRQAIKEACDE